MNLILIILIGAVIFGSYQAYIRKEQRYERKFNSIQKRKAALKAKEKSKQESE